VLLTLSSLGVGEIHVIHSQRVEKSYWSSPALKPDKVYQELILGLEQAKDTVLPQVIFHKGFKSFVEKALPGIIKGKKAFVAHPETGSSGLPDLSTEAVFIIGPEGGFIPHEIDLLLSKGVETVSLGRRIVKVETAITLLVSRCI
jgi:RsmE family RNA methyltransferase